MQKAFRFFDQRPGRLVNVIAWSGRWFAVSNIVNLPLMLPTMLLLGVVGMLVCFLFLEGCERI